MKTNEKELVKIDLEQFKLHVRIRGKMEMSLHFESPSRRFYLSVIALLVHEMQKLGRVTSIPLAEHQELLTLLNETIGGSAGSSERETLLMRIYKKWKAALPDLENAPLFRVLGKAKEYGEVSGKTYSFTDEEKDLWANLFEYKGSGENVRLRLSLDKLGVGLDQVTIVYGEEQHQEGATGWERFLKSLKRDNLQMQTQGPIPEEAPDAMPPIPHSQRKGIDGHLGQLNLEVPVLAELSPAAEVPGDLYSGPSKIEPASVNKMAFPLPDKPSIAVLTFANLSDDPQQEFFSEGISDDLITSISRLPNIFVIAATTFLDKGKPVNVQQVSRELGVKYILEGRLRKVGNRVRLTAQLIDGTTGQHLWAERYDRQMEDTFAIQDEITLRILKELQVKLTEGEQARLYARGTENIEAYLKYWQGRSYFLHLDKGGNTVARQIYEEAIALDPKWELPYSFLGFTHWLDAAYGYGSNPQESLKQAFQCAQKAMSLNESSSAHALLSWIYEITREYEKALEEGENCIALGPNSADAYAWYAQPLVFAGEPAKGVSIAEKALSMTPFPPSWYYNGLFWGHFSLRNYEQAIQACVKGINIDQTNLRPNLNIIIPYVLLGFETEARGQAQRVLSINPSFSVGHLSKTLPFKDRSETDRAVDPLRKAGLK